MTKYKIYNNDCIQEMQNLIEKNTKINLILTDPPYGTTARQWDKTIPYKQLWQTIEQLITDNGIICLFSVQPFTSLLITSNLKLYRYTWTWNKKTASNYLNSNYAPLKITEDINIFSKAKIGSLSKNPITYYPQGIQKINKKKKNNPKSTWRKNMGYNTTTNKLNTNTEYTQKYTNYPTNILEFPKDKTHYHPTQKPIALLEYLIKTYTKPNDTVLDFTMGSGSTGVACQNTNRDFIGIELDETYYDIAEERLKENGVQQRII